MKTTAFEMPDTTQVANLMVERMGETTLKPDSPVICLNRGRKTLQVTYNGNHIDVPVGYFRTEYGAALHMQKHLIVPGTRNLEQGGFVPWITIIGSDDGRVAVDPPENAVEFTDEEMQVFGESLEGLSREGRDPLVPIRTSAGRAMSRSQGTSFKPIVGVREQATDAAREASAHVFDPPEESLTRQAESEAASERVADAEAVPQPRPMKRR